MFTAPSLAESLDASAEVKVNTKRTSGASWDAFGGAPDIRVCVVTDFGTKCSDSLCRDSFECVARGLKVPDDEYKLRILDVDTEQHDLIGEVACTGLGECEPAGAVASVVVKNPAPRTMSVGAVSRPVEGCSCSFVAPEREARIPVFSANVDWSEAKMQINGENVSLGYQGETESPHVFLGPKGIKVSLDVKKTGDGMESSILEGTLTVEGEHQTSTHPVRGSCGC